MKRKDLVTELVVVGVLLVYQQAVVHGQTPSSQDDGDTNGQIFSARLEKENVTLLPTTLAPPPEVDSTPRPPKTDELIEPVEYAKLEKKLADDARAAPDKDKLVEVIATFKNTVTIPRFPGINGSEGLDSTGNVDAVQRAQELVRQIEGERAAIYDKRAEVLGADHSAREKDRFWLIDAMVLELPLSEVERLGARDDVQHLEYVLSDAPKPATVFDVRGIAQTDPYFPNWGSANRIALLDTGMRFTHTLNSNNGSGLRFDCVNGTSNSCQTGANLNPAEGCVTHGTSTGLIMMGNGNLGAGTRGITQIRLDSFKNANNCATNRPASVRSFQAAVAFARKLIVEEDDDTENEVGSISTAADAAFDSGAVVIVPAGNRGPGNNTTGAPGNAHKVVAVGAVDPTTLAVMNYSARGPQSDGRNKPDVVAPTNIITGSNVSNTSTWTFTGTSAATPVVGGAAALARNFMTSNVGDINPGVVYAFLINSGTGTTISSSTGTGVLRLPLDSNIWWGSASVANGAFQDIPFTASPGSIVEASIWWPEAPAVHSDVDLEIWRPGAALASATSSTTSLVFEKTRVTTSLTNGSWKIRIRGYNVPAGVTQQVHYSIRSQ